MSIATCIIQDLHAPPGIPFVFQIRDELPPFPIRQDLYQDLNGTTAIVVGVDGGIPKPPIVFRHGVGKGLNVSEAEFRETECEVGDKHGRPQISCCMECARQLGSNALDALLPRRLPRRIHSDSEPDFPFMATSTLLRSCPIYIDRAVIVVNKPPGVVCQLHDKKVCGLPQAPVVPNLTETHS